MALCEKWLIAINGGVCQQWRHLSVASEKWRISGCYYIGLRIWVFQNRLKVAYQRRGIGGIGEKA